MTWQNVEWFFAQAIIGVILNGILAIFLWRKKKADDQQANLPTDFQVFKQLVERRLNESEKVSEDLAIALLQAQRDLVGVRETVQWVKGRINGKGWNSPT